MPKQHYCKMCSVLTNSKCSNCNQVFYCTPEHQKLDWKSHKANCYPFKIDNNAELGRFLVSTRIIKPFEIILQESPLVRGPSQITGPVCLGCLNGIERNNYINCQKCGWLLCGPECEGNLEHKHECEFTIRRGKKVFIQEITTPHPMYQCVSTVRCLLLKKHGENEWNKFKQLQSLSDLRRGSAQWKADLESIGKFIPKFFNTTDFTEDEIMEAIGILQINGHDVPSTDPPHVAVFEQASFIEHSCLPNIAKSFTANGHIVLWAPKSIKRNVHLSICYSDALWGTADRQNHLMQTKIFRCSCLRCIDVTECGTNYSALKCKEEECDGVLLPDNPDKWDANWKCAICRASVSNLYVKNCLEKTGKHLQSTTQTVKDCLKTIGYCKKCLAPNHYNICELKIKLVQDIGKDPKELLKIPEKEIDVKVEYAKDLIGLYEKLAPCETRLLGILCFELHAGLAEYARRKSSRSAEATKSILQESLQCVEKAVNYLQHESEIYAEGLILKQAKINRDALKIVVNI